MREGGKDWTFKRVMYASKAGETLKTKAVETKDHLQQLNLQLTAFHLQVTTKFKQP